ncbi:MAG: DUF1588 domain-containing protein [Phycisphaeraceae bacterium]
MQSARTDTLQAVNNAAPASKQEHVDPVEVLETYCFSCHGPDEQKGSVRFDQLETTDPVQLQTLFGDAKEVVEWEDMPPAKSKQPSEAERAALIRWLDGKISPEEKKKLADKLRKPEYGNYVDHEALFSGEHADLPGYTTDRRWLISEFIFDAKFQRILENRTVANIRKGKRVDILGGHTIRDLSLANPFLLPEKSGVRYYANDDLTRGHLSAMLGNSHKTAIYITENKIKSGRQRDYLPATTEVLAPEDRHEKTLVGRREFLEEHIATVCEQLYGDDNQQWLPAFVPVVLKEEKAYSAEDLKKNKRLPVPVAQNTLKKSGGWAVLEQLVLDPANADKPDDAIIEMCERTWFYKGDYELDIQGRVALLHDYIADFRSRIAEDKRAKRTVYKPLDDAEMAVINAGIKKHRAKGDRYNAIIEKCLADWEAGFVRERIEAGPPSDELYGRMIEELFVQILERSPDTPEAEQYLALVKGYTDKLGRRKAVQKLIQTLLLTSEFVYRYEFGAGEPDEHGRRMLPPRDAAYAIAYALTDQSPDEQLLEAARTGKLNTREDYKREVERLLAQRDTYYRIDKKLADRWRDGNVTNMPIRELRFWREFFGYPKALTIFKDQKRFGARRLDRATNRLLEEADRMVAHILEEDKDVIEQLLTTEEFIVYHDGDSDRMQARSDEIKKIYAYFKDKDWQNFDKKDILEHADFLRTVDMRSIDPDKPDYRNRQGDFVKLFKKSVGSIVDRLDEGYAHAAPYDLYIGYGNDFMSGMYVGKFWNYELSDWDYSPVQPAKVPNRKGMLTHPAWLIAHAFNTETDPVHRGKWVREKLLAGTIPDVPITVDAQIPEDHDKTLRQRLAMATENQYCWRCHVDMNPLGNAFEMYDDFGRFRTVERLEYAGKLIEEGPEIPYGNQGSHMDDYRDLYETLPVDSTGYLHGTGDSSLDGEITGAIDLAERLGKSERVRQSIIRHAFRYFMGRNESLNDSKTLIDAEQAYLESGGSFDAVIVSLLTSDSFIYRKAIED